MLSLLVVAIGVDAKCNFEVEPDGHRIVVFQCWFKSPILNRLDSFRGQAKWCTLQHIDGGGFPSMVTTTDRITVPENSAARPASE